MLPSTCIEKTFYYRSKDEGLLFVNKNRLVSHNKIEIIPVHRNSFDFISFIDFAQATESIYYATEVTKNKKTKIVYSNMFIRKPAYSVTEGKYSFQVIFSKNLESINIFVKYNMTEFTYTNHEGFECICINYKSDKPGNIFISPHKVMTDSILYKVALYFTNGKRQCHECIKNYFMLYKNACEHQRDPSRMSQRYEIRDILSFCPGYVTIYNANYSLETGEKTDESHIQSISIIFPWAVDFLSNCHYIELDASFFGTSPYAYSITNTIFFNESMPIAINVAPCECHELFTMMLSNIDELSSNSIKFDQIVCLSDMGTAIESACKSYSIKQYYCYRHILEHFGTNGPLIFFVNKLLNSNSLFAYDQMRFQMIDELGEYEKQMRKEKKISKILADKLDDLKVMLLGADGDKKSKYYFENWALWIRREKNVAKCSNHAEALHSVINKNLGSCYSFEKKIKNLIETTLRHADTFPKRSGASIQRKRLYLMDYLQNKLLESSFDIYSVCKSQCDCEEDKYNQSIFGVYIPCKHQILTKAHDIIKEIEEYIEENAVDVSILDLLFAIISSDYIHYKAKPKVPDVTLKLFPMLAKKINIDLLSNLLLKIHDCFDYSVPKYPDFEMNWETHEIRELPAERVIIFDSKNTKNGNGWGRHIINMDIDKDDEETWLFSCQTLNQKQAKKKLYETILEINKMYPELNGKSAPYSICFDQFMKYINYQNDENIIEFLPIFKISCWKEADRFMKKNRFFG